MEVRAKLGDDVSLEAFQLFRNLGFESLLQAVGLEQAQSAEVLYMAGDAMGRELVRQGRIAGKTEEEVLASLKTLLEQTKFSLVETRHEGGDLYVDVVECVGCSGTQPVGHPVCHTEGGMIRGVLEALGAQYKVEEIRCIGGLGDEKCVFTVERT